MGLIINSTEEKKIVIQGTTIEVPNIYARLEFVGKLNGVTMQIGVVTFASETAYKSGASSFTTNVQQGTFQVNIDIEAGETQSIETALKYGKIAFIEQGYDVEITAE
jgi:hypothetical protein